MSAFSLDKAGPRTATCGSPFPVSCRLVTRGLPVSHRCRTRRVFASSAGTVATPAPPISVTDRALLHLQKLQSERKDDSLLLRIGVRSGGCSGMSYQMDFEAESNVMDEDSVIEIDSGRLKMVCDPKSLLYLFGMSLDYSDALIGGGFQFHNPNATDTCGCGKSFGV